MGYQLCIPPKHSQRAENIISNRPRRKQRSQNPPAPIRDSIQLLDIADPVKHEVRRILDLLLIDVTFADAFQTLVLGGHAQDEQNAHEILRPRKQVRHEAFLVLRRRHGDRPETGGFDRQRAAVRVFGRHGFGEVQGFVDEGSVHHESGVVEPCAELCCDDVEVIFVADWH